MPTAVFVDVLRGFVDLVSNGPPPSLEALSRALDELAMLVQDAPVGDLGNEDIDPPDREHADYKARYDALRTRFPKLGYYWVADPLGDAQPEALSGDAIDDLADIVGDLTEVIWRHDNAGRDEALWYFRFLFEIHWGLHLRQLSLYLHALRHSPESLDRAWAAEEGSAEI